MLPAVLDLDLEAWIVGADRRLQLRHLRVAGLLAAVYGHELVRVRTQSPEGLVDDLAVVLPGELEAVVDQPDHVALLDLETVRAGVAHGVRDLAPLHSLAPGLHRPHVFLRGPVG